MRIGFFTNMYRPFVGGVTRSIETVTADLRHLGHHVYIVAPTFENQEEEANLIRLPAISKAAHTDFSFPLPFALRFENHFDDLRLDLVHAHHPFLIGELGLKMARRHALPLVFTHHTRYEDYAHYLPMDNEAAQRLLIEVEVMFCNECDLILAPSESIRQMILERGVEAEVVTQPTGIDVAAYGPVDRAAVRADLGVPEGAPFVLHVGRLAREKNLFTLLEAFKLITESLPEARLVVCGSGPEEDAIRARATELDLDRSLIWSGRQGAESLRDVYSAADLFLFSSVTETQGLVIVEAMAGGTPVVAVDATGARDVIRDGIDGRLTADSPPELAEAAVALLRDPARLRAFGRAARSRAEQFDRRVMAGRLLGHYDRLLARPPAALNPKTTVLEKSLNLLFGMMEDYWGESRPVATD